MKYVSLDIETGGLTHDLSLFEIGMVFDDGVSPIEELRKARISVVPADRTVRISLDCIDMHRDLLDRIRRLEFPISDNYSCRQVIDDVLEVSVTLQTDAAPSVKGEVFYTTLVRLLETRIPPTLLFAGKNVAGFDLPWLRATGWIHPNLKIAHRTIDPAMLYTKWDDDRPASLPECLKRAGMEPTADHTALGDALDVVRLVRHALVGPALAGQIAKV